MQTNIHHPQVHDIVTHTDDVGNTTFHTVRLQEKDHGAVSGTVVAFINEDWDEWDALVMAVANYRAAGMPRSPEDEVVDAWAQRDEVFRAHDAEDTP